MFPPRSCAIQNSWYCLAHSCPVFCFTPSVLKPYKYEAIKETPRRIQESTQKKGEKKGEEGRQAPEPHPEPRGTRKSMMEQNPFPEERKKREEGRQAPEPQPEPRGTSKP